MEGTSATSSWTETRKNIKAMDMLVTAMRRSGMGYASINHPVDHCKACGFTGIIDNECPQCKTGMRL